MSPRPVASETASDAQRRLCIVAADLIAERGLASCSARAVASRAGVSASAINYHFERYDQLLALALDRARERDLEWRRGALESLRHREIDPALLGSLLTGMVTATGVHHRALALIRWDVAIEAALSQRFKAIARRWSDDLAEFWRHVLIGSGKAEAGTLVAELCDALARIYLAVGTSATHIAWVAQACERIAQCLLGRRSVSADAQCWRDLHRGDISDEGSKSRGATFDRMVEGALRVVLAEGAHRLTHRHVASASGVSLSSTTYHFASRADVLKAAFLELRAQTIERALSHEFATQEMTVDQLLIRMQDALVPDNSGVVRAYVAAQTLLNYAARDPDLSRCSQDIYACVGNPTLSLFSRTTTIAGRADQLSAFIFAVWTDVMLCNASLETGEIVKSRIHASQRQMLGLLFGDLAGL